LPGLGAERGFLRGVIEIHGGPLTFCNLVSASRPHGEEALAPS
jgi:hypothetical protein